jgi:hypothetical protein
MPVLYTSVTCGMLQSLPFLLKDLVKEEVEFINQTLINSQDPAVRLVVDPTPEIQIVLTAFMDWYNHLRQPMLTVEDLKELGTKTWRVQFACKQVFPSKSGVRGTLEAKNVYSTWCTDGFHAVQGRHKLGE